MNPEFSAEERQIFAYERYHYPDPLVQQRMEVLWLKSQGLSHHQIAQIANVGINSVTNYLKMYQEGGIERQEAS